MPSRVVNTLTCEVSTPSESDTPFVSVEEASKKTTALKRTKGSAIDQSATATPSSPHRSVAPKNFESPSPNYPTTTSDTSNSIDQRNRATLSPSCSRRLSALLSPPVGSYFTQQSGTSGSDPRSPQTRRPPASRSSHGIETKLGPPPALSTRCSYKEPLRRKSPSAEVRARHPPLILPSNPVNSIDFLVKLPHGPADDDTRAQQLKPSRVVHARPSTSDGIMTAMETRNYRRSESDEERDSTLRIKDRTSQRDGNPWGVDTQDRPQSSNEDLFLKLAQDDSVVDEPSKRNESRRSRTGTSNFSQSRTSRPSSSDRPSTSGGQQNHSHESSFDSYSPRSQGKGSLTSLRDPSLKSRPYAASAHPLDQRHRAPSMRSFGTKTEEQSNEEGMPGTQMPHGRRRSLREPSPGAGARIYKQSHLSHTPNGDYRPSPNRFSSAYGRESVREIPPAEGTESTVSTTAPSTVWDELDELKSRMRKLELTGLLANSPKAESSNVNGNRPLTATTTVTTISSSPKRRQLGSVSPEASTIKSSSLTGLHPLLHSALAKVKPLVDPDLYRALEGTASDASSLAAMTGSTGSQGASTSPASVSGLPGGIDRQLRRKADSMCRSLTELCIALAECLPKAEASMYRSESQAASSREVALPNPRLLRGASDESETRTNSSVMKRLEARRSSLLASSSLSSRRGSPQEATTPTQASTPISSRLDRHSSITLRARSNADEADISSSRRPSSRAATEIGQMRPSPQTRISREYTSQHPMPGSSQQSPSTQPSLPIRKSYFGSATSSPRTPSVQPGNRRYLDRSTPPSSADSASLAEARQRRLASLGQGQSRIALSSGRLRQPESEQQR